MKEFVRVMKALSEPSRVRTLKLLQERDLCVCELQHLLQLAQSTVSKHLKILEEAGLVEHERRGAWIVYRLAEGNESVYAAAMLSWLREWLDDDKEFTDMRLRLPETESIRRNCPD